MARCGSSPASACTAWRTISCCTAAGTRGPDAADRHGDLWLGTENQGLLRISAHGLERLPAGLNLPGGRVVSLREDAEGSIWAGANGGLYRLRETLFSSYTERDGLVATMCARC
jgi:ligand-binding sensor domain-containing protein